MHTHNIRSSRIRLLRPRRSRPSTLATLALTCLALPAVAQDQSTESVLPPRATLDLQAPAQRTFPINQSGAGAPLEKAQTLAQDNEEDALPTIASGTIPEEVHYTLTAKYMKGSIYNPSTDVDDPVELRAFTGPDTNPAIPFVAPVVDLVPGQTFRLTLKNEMPSFDPSCDHTGGVNHPHCFNSTNMHTHGFWVSPTGNSDNVLITLRPEDEDNGVPGEFTYEYNLPPDHAAGTFWYHPHLHGSTALQVTSGMVGPLIVHGNRLPQLPDGTEAGTDPGTEWKTTGDIDMILQTQDDNRNMKPFDDNILLFQQISYACRDAKKFDPNDPTTFPAYRTAPIETGDGGAWICKEGQVGTIEGYDQLGLTFPNGKPVSNWSQSGRHTSINGIVAKNVFHATTDTPTRWRAIHAGVRDTINLEIRAYTGDPLDSNGSDTVASRFKGMGQSPEKDAKTIDENCGGQPLPLFDMASDGLTRSKIYRTENVVLQPGYREDLLTVFNHPGTYCLFDAPMKDQATVAQSAHTQAFLGTIEVTGPDYEEDAAVRLQAALIQGARLASKNLGLEDKELEAIVADLSDGLKLTAFVPHPDVTDEEVADQPEETLGFNIGDGPSFEIGTLEQDEGGDYHLVAAKPYDPDVIDRKLPLGKAQEWVLTSFNAGHPFHIHVNPFEIMSAVDDKGNDLLHQKGSQYEGMQGVWRDTLFVNNGDIIKIRTRYERYIGEFVLHCHILDHEDEGMMQNVMIGLPESGGGVATHG